MEKVAIVGTGIAGMSAAWLLHKKYDITVFEQNDYIGGHTNTVDVKEDGATSRLIQGLSFSIKRIIPTW